MILDVPIALFYRPPERWKMSSSPKPTRGSLAADPQTQALFRRPEAGLHDFLDNAVVPIHWVGPDGTILWANRAELEMLGYTAEEYIGRHIAEFHVDEPVIENLLERLRRNESLRDQEARLRCKDGSIKDVLISSNVMWEGGEFVHTRCFTLDATHRKRAEQALRESEERHRRIIQAANEGVWEIDRDGRTTRVNPRMAEMLGYDLTEMIGRPVLDFCFEEDHEKALERIRANLEGASEEFEFRFRHRDGRELLVLACTGPVSDAEGRAGGALGLFTDVTDRLRARQRLEMQYAIVRVLAESTTLREAAPRILKAVCEITGWEMGAAWRVDDEDRVLRCVETWHAPGSATRAFEEVTRARTFEQGIGLPGRVWQSGRAHWIEDVTSDPNFPRAAIAAREGLHGAFCFPIRARDEILGVIEFFSHEIRQPEPDLLQMMDATGSEIGQFIERRDAEMEVEERARRQEAVGRLGQAALASSDVPALLDTAARLVARALEVEFCGLLELEPGGASLRMVAGTGWNAGVVGRVEVPAGAGSQAGYTLLSAEPVVLRDLRTETRFTGPPHLHDHGVLSGVSVAIGEPADPWGVLVAQTRHLRRFTPDDLLFLQSIAHLLSVAIDRKLTEDALRESEQRFGLFMRHLPGLAWMKDGEGRYVYLNESAEKAFGGSLEKLRGLTDHQIFPPETAAQFVVNDREVIESGATLQTIETFTQDDGVVHHSIVNKFGIPSANGATAIVAGVAFDVTERIRAEAALRESEDRLRRALEAGLMGGWEWHLATGRVKGSPALEPMHGLAPGSFDGNPEVLERRIHPDDLGPTLRALASAIQAGLDFRVEYRVVRPEGGVTWVESRGRVLNDEEGRPARVTGVSIDVTERRRAERHLRESEERLKMALDAGRMGTWEWQIATGEVLWSPSLERMHGLRPGTFPGRIEAFQDEIYQEDRAFVLAAVEQAVRDLSDYHVEYRVLKPTGEITWVEARGRVFTGSDGAPVRMAGVCMDVTERKQFEMELQNLNETLEQRVAERSELVKLLQELVVSSSEAESSEMALREALDRICAQLGWPVGHAYFARAGEEDLFEDSGIWSLKDPDRYARLVAVSRKTTFKRGQGLVGRVAESGRPEWLQDLETPGRFLHSTRGEDLGIRTAFALPVLVGRGVVAVLEFFSPETERHDEALLDILGQAGTQLGRVIERKRAEAAIRESEERFRLLVEGVKDHALYTLDPRGHVTSWNAGAQRIHGYATHEIMGEHISTFYPGPEVRASKAKRALRRAALEGRFADEGWRLRKGGPRFWASVAITALHDEEGRLRGFAKLTRDISERLELEKQIANLAAEERRRISHALHDGLGQQITGIGMLARTLQRRLEAKGMPEKENAERLVKSIDDAKAQMRVLWKGLTPVEVDAAGLMSALEELCQSASAMRDARVRFRCDRPVAIDDNVKATNLYLIAQESVYNALKHTKARRITVSLQGRGAGALTLKIQDDGGGMKARARKSEGMGLKIMRYRAGLIGGTLEIHSVKRKGTLVTCTIAPDETEERRSKHAREA